jgi:hypothetical protein
MGGGYLTVANYNSALFTGLSGYAAKIVSISSIFFCVSFHRAAAAFAAICSGREAPEMMLAMDGCAASQEIAKVSKSYP